MKLLLKEKKHHIIFIYSLRLLLLFINLYRSRRVIDVFPMQILYLNNNRKENAEK